MLTTHASCARCNVAPSLESPHVTLRVDCVGCLARRVADPPTVAHSQAGGRSAAVHASAPKEGAQFAFLVGQWEVTVMPKVSSLAAKIHGAAQASRDLEGVARLRRLRHRGRAAHRRPLRQSERARRTRCELSMRRGALDADHARRLSRALHHRRRRIVANGTMTLRSAGTDAEGKPVLQRARFFDITPTILQVPDRSLAAMAGAAGRPRLAHRGQARGRDRAAMTDRMTAARWRRAPVRRWRAASPPRLGLGCTCSSRWLPVWALYTTLIADRARRRRSRRRASSGPRAIAAAALLGSPCSVSPNGSRGHARSRRASSRVHLPARPVCRARGWVLDGSARCARRCTRVAARSGAGRWRRSSSSASGST